jgi:hypothetical protein
MLDKRRIIFVSVPVVVVEGIHKRRRVLRCTTRGSRLAGTVPVVGIEKPHMEIKYVAKYVYYIMMKDAMLLLFLNLNV